MSNADELKKLKELLDSGVLSKEEFEIEKSKIIATKDSSSKYEDNLGKKVRNSKKTIVYASIALVVIMIGVFYFVNTNNKTASANCELFSSELRLNVTGGLAKLKDFAYVLSLSDTGIVNWEKAYKTSNEQKKVLGFHLDNIEKLSPPSNLKESYNIILTAFSDIVDGVGIVSRAAYDKNIVSLNYGKNSINNSLDVLLDGLNLLNQNSCEI